MYDQLLSLIVKILVNLLGRSTHALENGRKTHKSSNISDAKCISALLDRCSASSGERASQESNMSRLIIANLDQVLVKGRIVASSGKVGLSVIGKSLSVELVLEVFQRERIVQDIDIVELGQGLSFLERARMWSSVAGSCKSQQSGNGGLHIDNIDLSMNE